jgi:hypothetical protein
MTIHSHKLVGLKQGVYISQCLAEGQPREDLVSAFEGGEQLVGMWISFLENTRWIEGSQGNGWSLTARGKVWNDKLSLFAELPDDDERRQLRGFAKEAFGVIKDALSESNIEPNLWSVLTFLLKHAKEMPFDYSV